MAHFNYRAIDQSSRIVEGRIEAVDEDHLDQRLSQDGLKLIEATKTAFAFGGRLGMKEKDLLSFTYFLHLILSSGMPITGGLNDLSRQTANRNISQTASLIYARLAAGKSISDSMADYPNLFPSFYSSMVRAGEISGRLEQVLADIMAYLEWRIQLKKDIRSALAYPVMVLTAVISLIALLFIFVMPKFIRILTDLHVSLPLPTKILVYTVDFVKGYWPLILMFFIILPFLYRYVRSRPGGRRLIDSAFLSLPLFGELVRKLSHSRYFRTFATLYRAGLNMNDTLGVSSGVVKNTVIADEFNSVTNAVIGGAQLSTALRTSGNFAPLLINMVEVGEKTGTLDDTITRISNMYDREIPETIKRIFLFIEPAMLLLLGGLVLLTLASFFLSLYKIVGGIHR